jgi:urocanate hydratase
VEEWRIDKRLETRYLDEKYTDIDAAIDAAVAAKKAEKAISIGVVANATELLGRLIERNITPDTLTDQTSAHDEGSYFPDGMSVEAAKTLKSVNPDEFRSRSLDTMAKHVKLMLELQKRGAITFDYGNNLRGQAKDKRGVENAFNFPGFVPAYIRPLFCKGSGPFRFVALSGDAEDIKVCDEKLLELFPENKGLERWIRLASEKIAFQGLPARICWLAMGERQKAALAFNELVRTGKVKAPIVIGRDHLDTGSVASPNRETEAMLDGSDAVSDWPILNALINTAGGASWVSFHHGGGVGMGYSLHAGMVIVADGTEDAERRLRRVLNNDPAMGVIRHADAGYDIAKDTARKFRLDLESRF